MHPDYADLAVWSGRESADIVYNDVDAALTQWLVAAGLLQGEDWQTARPTYFIEVKSTLGECEREFYMSQNQVDMVCNCPIIS